MQWIKRFYELDPSALFKKGKVVILYGARRVGKTMLMEKLLAGTEGKIFKGSGDDFELVAILSSRKIETYRLFFSPYSVIFIDEAQYVPNIGACAKLLIDLFPEKSVILTGSSAFNLSQTILSLSRDEASSGFYSQYRSWNSNSNGPIFRSFRTSSHI